MRWRECAKRLRRGEIREDRGRSRPRVRALTGKRQDFRCGGVGSPNATPLVVLSDFGQLLSRALGIDIPSCLPYGHGVAEDVRAGAGPAAVRMVGGLPWKGHAGRLRRGDSAMRRHMRVALLLVLAIAALPAAVALAKRAVDVSGTVWHFGTTQVQLKVQKAGGFKQTGEAWLYLGPLPAAGHDVVMDLGDDEFLFEMDPGPSYTGTWSDPKLNGNVILAFDANDVANSLERDVTDVVKNAFPGQHISDASVNVTKLQVKCKCQPGKNASFSLKAGFLADTVIDADPMQGKGSYSVKGKGVEGILTPP